MKTILSMFAISMFLISAFSGCIGNNQLKSGIVSIEGTVKDAIGVPVENATVCFSSGASNFSTATDRNGNYIIANIPTDDYVAKASKGFVGQSRNISISSDSVENVNFELPGDLSTANETELYDSRTWAFMLYDWTASTGNYENVMPPRQQMSVQLSIANTMCEKLVEVAAQIKRDTKYDTLLALEAYNVENIDYLKNDRFYKEYGVLGYTPGMNSVFRKHTADNMFAIKDSSISGKMMADCCGLTCWNHAILRLAGFGPEEAFMEWIPGHIFNVVRVENGKWYALDSTLNGQSTVEWVVSPNHIHDEYVWSNIVGWFNDRYVIEFSYSRYVDSCIDNDDYCNMEPEKLRTMIDEIKPLIGDAKFGDDYKPEKIEKYIENMKYPNKFIDVALPDFDLSNPSAAHKAIVEYVEEVAKVHSSSQYGCAVWSQGRIDESTISFMQPYARAAKLADYPGLRDMVTSSPHMDTPSPESDIIAAYSWTSSTIITQRLASKELIMEPDFTFITGKGSSLDKALFAYGTMRNMKKDADYWQPSDVFILMDKDYNGYLAVNLSGSWIYTDFTETGVANTAQSILLNTDAPENIVVAFNENETRQKWQ
jgi:hypothetical protein